MKNSDVHRPRVEIRYIRSTNYLQSLDKKNVRDVQVDWLFDRDEEEKTRGTVWVVLVFAPKWILLHGQISPVRVARTARCCRIEGIIFPACAPLSWLNWYPLFVDGPANYLAPRTDVLKGSGD